TDPYRQAWMPASLVTGVAQAGDPDCGYRLAADACTGSDFQRIVLVDGPAVLGPGAWNDLVEQPGLGLLRGWVRRAIDDGQIDAVHPGATAGPVPRRRGRGGVCAELEHGVGALRADDGDPAERGPAPAWAPAPFPHDAVSCSAIQQGGSDDAPGAD